MGTGTYSGTRKNLAWRLPLFVQCIPAAINAAFIFLCPESWAFSVCSLISSSHIILSRPRWLYATGKSRKAREILAKLHSNDGNIDSPLVALEMTEIEEKISLTGADS